MLPILHRDIVAILLASDFFFFPKKLIGANIVETSARTREQVDHAFGLMADAVTKVHFITGPVSAP
jgi:hypothetical protein